MMVPLVSIIVPCYNHSRYLKECVKSVLLQTYNNWECLIVDDGSTDDTYNISKELQEIDNRIRYLNKENGGLSSARNFGIRQSRGTLILTLDADDMFQKTFLQKATTILEKNPLVGVVSCWGQRFYDSDYKLDVFKPKGGTIEDFLFENSAIGNSLFRKKCWEDAGGYDENMRQGYEDWEFYISVSKNGWKVEVINEVLFYYRQHKTSMRTVALNEYDTTIRNNIMTKHKDLYQDYFLETLHYYVQKGNNYRKDMLKHQNKLEYKIGSLILKPIRFIKSIFK
ncbi:glycosyltransferase family 2 protein [Flavobacterium soli]|uniref:glycosyltransferase family 2 protein n=1 Tax=Flavobacterium soli TaxID=344881 RepID=UPI000478923E|nr:glycosyltransferase family A protein [Flavobacterium soli]